jgi:DNA-3-methyladenine glycosylase II
MAQLFLHPIPPFRLDLTVWVLRRLAINQIDRWDGQTYRRVLVPGKSPVLASVTQTAPAGVPEISVMLEGDLPKQEGAANLVRRLLGLDIDLSGFYRLAQSDQRLSVIAERFVGFKPPRFSSAFEGLVNGIACQQLSLNVGIILLNRLAAEFGAAIGHQHAFPGPEDLAPGKIEDLRRLGFSGRKAEGILSLSRLVLSREIDLEALEEMDDESVVKRLCEIPGVGRWTAEYVALRGLGRLDVFPADDIGAQNNLQRWLGLPKRPVYNEVHGILDRWRPYRGLIYFHLLLDSQSRRGLLEHGNQNDES